MEQLTLDHLRHNAYRVLGLTSAAGQADIEAAARLMRLYSGDSAPTANDARWLGPVKRMPDDVEHALMRLADPATRVAERIWWFCLTPPQKKPAPAGKDGAALSLEARHDAALGGLIRLLLAPAGSGSIDQWSNALHEFHAAAGSAPYRRWVRDAEDRGDFEKRADADETAHLHDRALSLAAQAVRKLADEFLRQDAFAAAGRCVGLLRETPDGCSGQEDDAVGLVLNRMEDELATRCADSKDRVRRAWAARQIKTLKPTCKTAVKACRSVHRLLLEEILRWSGGEEHRRDRAAANVSGLLWYVADAYEGCYDRWKARETLRYAVTLVAGTSSEARLRRRIEGLRDAKRRPQVPASARSGIGGRIRPWVILGALIIGLIRGLATNTSQPAAHYDIPAFPQLPPPLSTREFSDLDSAIKAYQNWTDATRATLPALTRPAAGSSPFTPYDPQLPGTNPAFERELQGLITTKPAPLWTTTSPGVER